MEAALRTAQYLLTKKPPETLEFAEITDLEKGVKEMTVNIAGTEIKVAVAHGIGNIQALMQKVKEAKEKGEPTPYHFIEVMACPGGCIGGGGQPMGVTDRIRNARKQGLMKDDRNSVFRSSYENPEIQHLYNEFLGHPLSEKAHELLHTHYQARPLYKK